MTRSSVVLYAEDDENDVFFMERAFTRLGRAGTLRVAQNGTEAIAYLGGTGPFADRDQNPVPGLLLLDVKLPQRSGLEVLAWARSRREFDGLPIVMFTSSTQETDIQYCRTHGANAYLMKPANAEQLNRTLEQIIAGADVLPAAAARLSIEGNLL